MKTLVTLIEQKKRQQLDLTSSRYSRFNQKIQQYDPVLAIDEDDLTSKGFENGRRVRS